MKKLTAILFVCLCCTVFGAKAQEVPGGALIKDTLRTVVDVPSGQALRGYRFSLLGAPVLTLNFEEVIMTLKLDSESGEGDLVVESGELEDVVMLK